ncbi:MAG: GNAT family N-acetyltransferase [Steroidobacteraceae bacterium]
MIDGLAIAWCGPEAAELVHQLTQAAFAPQALLDPPSGAVSETVEVVREHLTSGRGIVATVGGEAVATARVGLHDEYLHLRRLAVRPDCQRRGIGRAIMLWLRCQAPKLGRHEIRLGVRHDMPGNRALYAALDYLPLSEHGYWTEMRLRLA